MATTQAIFKVRKDAGEPLDITQELTALDLIRYTVPAGGPFVTGAPQSNTLTAGAEVLLSPLATIAANTLTNPMTAANVLLFKEVSEGGVAANLGPAVEREVVTRNRNQTVAFGDLNFMCPSTGGSQLNMRRGSNPSMTVTNFSTKWSNQQGAASEQTPTFTVSTSWRPFRSAGLNLTQHNNWQEGTFVCNGWLYNIQVFVGSGWNNNRFSCSRWRLDAVKGDPGADAASIDHISKTAGDSSPGTTDTYTLWADAGETTALGTYDVPIPSLAGPRTYTVSTAWTGGLSNSNFQMGPFQVEQSGVYQYTMDAQGADTQGNRVAFNFEIRDTANGGGNQIASSYLSVETGAGASNGTFNLPQAQGTVPLVAGTDYWVFGDRNTGGLFTGNRWTLELTGP